MLTGDMCKPRDKAIIQLNLKYVLKFKDDWGNTPLHIACFHRAPPDAIEILLKLADIAALGEDKNVKGNVLSHEVVTAQTTNDGSTPLIIACGMNMPLGSIKHLIFYHNYKLGSAATGQLVRMADSTGSLPLSYLLSTEQKSLYSQDQFLELLNKIRLLVFVYEHSASLEKLNVLHDISTEEYNEGDPKVFYYKTFLKALAICPFTCPPRTWMDGFASKLTGESDCMLEDCLGYFNDIVRIDNEPRQMQSALRHVINASYEDIISCPADVNSPNENEKNYLTNQATVVHYLLKIFPDAAREKMKSLAKAKIEKLEMKYWESPLCHAVLNGLWWDGFCSREKPHGDVIIYGPVRSLWEAAPETADQKGSKTGLYPFMLAATIVESGNLNEISDADRATLDIRRLSTIYGLLRMSPHLL